MKTSFALRTMQLLASMVPVGVFFASLWLPGYVLGHVSNGVAWLESLIGAGQ